MVSWMSKLKTLQILKNIIMLNVKAIPLFKKYTVTHWAYNGGKTEKARHFIFLTYWTEFQSA
jgi:hypothetical protein